MLSRPGPNKMFLSPKGKFLNRWSPVCLGSTAILFSVQFWRQLETYLHSSAEWVGLAAITCFQQGLETRTLFIRSVLAQHISVGHKNSVTTSDSIAAEQCHVLLCVLHFIFLSQQMFLICHVTKAHTEMALTFGSNCVCISKCFYYVFFCYVYIAEKTQTLYVFIYIYILCGPNFFQFLLIFKENKTICITNTILTTELFLQNKQ